MKSHCFITGVLKQEKYSNDLYMCLTCLTLNVLVIDGTKSPKSRLLSLRLTHEYPTVYVILLKRARTQTYLAISVYFKRCWFLLTEIVV